MAAPIIPPVHQRYVGKRWRIQHGSWYDEFWRDERIYIAAQSVLEPIGFLENEPARMVWRILSYTTPTSKMIQPRTFGALIDRTRVLLFPEVAAPPRETLVFVLHGYDGTFGEHLGTALPKRIIPDFPHRCPSCSGPAYIGFKEIVCQRSGCDPMQKRNQP